MSSFLYSLILIWMFFAPFFDYAIKVKLISYFSARVRINVIMKRATIIFHFIDWAFFTRYANTIIISFVIFIFSYTVPHAN